MDKYCDMITMQALMGLSRNVLLHLVDPVHFDSRCQANLPIWQEDCVMHWWNLRLREDGALQEYQQLLQGL